MMKRFTQYCLLIMISMAVHSCNEPVLQESKANYLQHFESFLAAIKEQQQAFTDEDWQAADRKFTKLSRAEFDLYEADLTEAEKSRIDKWIGQYNSFKIKSRLKILQQDASHIFIRLKTTVQELKKP